MGEIASLSGNRGEECEEVRKRMTGVCCLLEVRRRGRGDRMLVMEGRKYVTADWKRRWG